MLSEGWACSVIFVKEVRRDLAANSPPYLLRVLSIEYSAGEFLYSSSI